MTLMQAPDRLLLRAGMLALLVFLWSISAMAADKSSLEDFYDNKAFRVVVGYSPGGGWDTVARVFAKHFGNHLPGNPRVLVVNMPGAGGLVARNTVLKSWPQDGTGIVSMSLSEVPLVAFGKAKTQFDYNRINWVGSMTSDVNICFVRRDSGIDDMTKEAVNLGALAPASSSYRVASFVKNALNPKVKIIPGYRGSSQVYAAMERGEVDGYCITRGSVVAARPDWLDGDSSYAKVLLQLAPEKSPEMPDVPLHLDYAKDGEERALFNLAMSDAAFGRPIAMGADIPEDRVQAIQKAFMDTMKDPAFVADAKKIGMPLNPKPGREVGAWVKDFLNLPPEKLKVLEGWFVQ